MEVHPQTGQTALPSHTDQAKTLTGEIPQPRKLVDREALGPQPPGGLPIETQENTGFIKKVAEKLHIRSRETDPHPQHRRTEGYVEAGVHGGMEQAFDLLTREEYIAIITNLVRVQGRVGTETAIRVGLEVLGDQKGMEAVGKLTRAQAIILADQALTELGRTAARTAATEAVTGSYDALEKKYLEFAGGTWTKVVLVPTVAAIGSMFGAGLLLALWRFVLFGLGPIF